MSAIAIVGLRSGGAGRGGYLFGTGEPSLSISERIYPIALPYYGFCYFDGQIVKDPREFPIPQTIHKHWSKGRSIHQVNLELNRAKLP